MGQPLLAKVYIDGGKSVAYPTYPGNFLYFRGGCADVRDHKSMPAALRMEKAIVEVEPDWVDWIPKWVEQCPEQTPVKAEIKVSGRPFGEPAPVEPMNVVPLGPPNPENPPVLTQELEQDDMAWMKNMVSGLSDTFTKLETVPQTVPAEPKPRGRPRKAWAQ